MTIAYTIIIIFNHQSPCLEITINYSHDTSSPPNLLPTFNSLSNHKEFGLKDQFYLSPQESHITCCHSSINRIRKSPKNSRSIKIYYNNKLKQWKLNGHFGLEYGMEQYIPLDSSSYQSYLRQPSSFHLCYYSKKQRTIGLVCL